MWKSILARTCAERLFFVAGSSFSLLMVSPVAFGAPRYPVQSLQIYARTRPRRGSNRPFFEARSRHYGQRAIKPEESAHPCEPTRRSSPFSAIGRVGIAFLEIVEKAVDLLHALSVYLGVGAL